MYIKSLELKNFKSFGRETIQFRSPTDADADPALFPNVTLLLGDNGSGKSSVLRGAALALVGDILARAGFVPHTLVRREKSRQAKSAELRATAVLHWHDVGASKASSDVEEAELAVRVNRYRLREELDAIMPVSLAHVYAVARESEHSRLVFGYSATRRVEQPDNYDRAARKTNRLAHYARVASLFEEQFTLVPLAAWLPRFDKENPGRAKQVRRILADLLPDDCSFTGKFEQGDYQFRHRGTTLPFSALSDGYRAYVGWIGDLLYHLAMSCPNGVKLTESHAVVLVDEVDLHLHPSWQMSVVPRLARVLPKVQFVFTSHSPIVAGSLEAWNVIRIERSEQGPSVVNRSTAPLHGLSAEQVLLSPYFGMESTRTDDARHSLELRALKAVKGDDVAAREFVLQLAGKIPVEQASVRAKPKESGRSATSKGKSRVTTPSRTRTSA